MSDYTNFTSIGDSSLGLGDDNRAFEDFVKYGKENIKDKILKGDR